ncbi:AHH domain-containing protein [Oceanobacter mangrovi]|uniref:AHH domain-containing protein n=1 Tax=Oceanobacter mangrovi TaxID=2862510 RepID=UPI001C8D4225|nr:AHH domain-containing protein [Oceanobacter mangrovi]
MPKRESKTSFPALGRNKAGITKSTTRQSIPRAAKIGKSYAKMDTEKAVLVKEDGSYNGGRQYGNSTILRKALHQKHIERNQARQKPVLEFSDWKNKHTGEEAQHLIPASVGDKLNISSNFIDSARNGMMLPAYPQRTGNNNSDRPFHRQSVNTLHHSTYNSSVKKSIDSLLKSKKIKKNQKDFGKVTDALRYAHKNNDVENVDGISKRMILDAWNIVNPED